MHIQQNNPDFKLDYHYNKETKQVKVSLKVGVFPTITIYLTPSKFFVLMAAVVKTTMPFIDYLEKLLKSEKDEEFKVEFKPEERTKMEELRKRYEQGER